MKCSRRRAHTARDTSQGLKRLQRDLDAVEEIKQHYGGPDWPRQEPRQEPSSLVFNGMTIPVYDRHTATGLSVSVMFLGLLGTIIFWSPRWAIIAAVVNFYIWVIWGYIRTNLRWMREHEARSAGLENWRDLR